MKEEDIERFEIKQIFNYEYLEGRRKLEYHNYRSILETFDGNSPLHIAIMRNSYPCVRLLCEETSIPIIDEKEIETPVIIACKHAVSIEILETLLVLLRTHLSIEQVKEYLELKDAGGLRAYDYCKAKKRSDLAVVLAEFVDTTKSVLEVGFTEIEGGFDFKA